MTGAWTHSFVNTQLKQGVITEEEARESLQRNIITRALGMNETVVPDTGVFELENGDLFLLCSDGLSDMVLHDIISNVLADEEAELSSKAETLVQMANDRGGLDNITLILARVTDSLPQED